MKPRSISPGPAVSFGNRSTVAVLALSLFALGQKPVDAPPKAEKVGNLHAVVATYTLDYGSGSDQVLEMAYGFPERARWQQTVLDGNKRVLRIYNRFGERTYERLETSGASTVLTGAKHLDQLRQIELMQAVLLWPDCFDWKDVRGSRMHDMGATGLLIVDPFEGERPGTFRSFGADGIEREVVIVEAWEIEHERAWPARWKLESALTRLTATRVSIDTSARFSDAFFVPPDQRDRAFTSAHTKLRHIDLAARPARRVPLPDGDDWKEQVERARKLRGAWKGEQAELAPWLTLELDARARPSALWLELRDASRVPEGWTLRPPRMALAVAVENERRVTRELMQKMRSKLAPGIVPGTTLARMAVDGEGTIDVLLPLSTAR